MLISQAKVTSKLLWQFIWSSCVVSEISLRFSPLQDLQPSSPAHPGNRPLGSGFPFLEPTWCLARVWQNGRVLGSPEERGSPCGTRDGFRWHSGCFDVQAQHEACEWCSVKAISFLILTGAFSWSPWDHLYLVLLWLEHLHLHYRLISQFNNEETTPSSEHQLQQVLKYNLNFTAFNFTGFFLFKTSDTGLLFTIDIFIRVILKSYLIFEKVKLKNTIMVRRLRGFGHELGNDQ